MNESKIIFIGGIHGVGKTTFCTYVSSDIKIKHYSSSELISKQNSDIVRRDKIVRDLEGNQDILIEAIAQYCSDGEKYLLDGHFCLINASNEIERITIEIFQKINPIAITVIIDDESRIAERLERRDLKKYSIDFIRSFQDEETKYAKKICEDIGIELKIIDLKDNISDNIKIFNEIIKMA